MAVSVDSIMECVGNPLKARVLMLMKEYGPMTPKQILNEDPRIAPASLYRALKSMEEARVIVTVSETKVRAMVEKTYTLNEELKKQYKESAIPDAEAYAKMFMGFAFNLMRRFEAYATQHTNDVRKDAVEFSSVPIYATPDELRRCMDGIMEVLAPYRVRSSDEQELRSIALVSAPPCNGFKEVKE